VSVYGLVLSLHSALRWAVLAVALFAIVRSFGGWRSGRAWQRADERASVTLVGLVDLQFLLGLALYAALSPLIPAFFADSRRGLGVPALRFFAVEHVLVMLAALASVHVGRVLSRRATAPERRHRRVLLSTVLLLVLLAAGIPWPFLPYGRPLLRGLG
jgi:hypothetical protein